MFHLCTKGKSGTKPLSSTLPALIKQKIISQTLPFPQGWLSLLSTPGYLLPLSLFPWHHVRSMARSESVGWDNDAIPSHIHSYLERDEGGKRHCQTGNPVPGMYQAPWYNPSIAWFLPRSDDRNRFSVGLLGPDSRSCTLLSYYKAQLYIK